MPTAAAVASPAINPGASPAAGTTLSAEQVEKTRQSAKDFESMAVAELLRPMFQTVDSSKGLFGGGAGEAAWQPMMVNEMAKMLVKGGGIGIADAVLKEMLHMQEAKHG